MQLQNVNSFSWKWQTQSNPSSTTMGIVGTPGFSNGEGSWITLGAASDVTTDVWGIELIISANYVAGTAISTVIDIGVDPAGGTSFSPIVENLQGGQAGNHYGKSYFYLPIKIPAGASIGIRGSTSHASATFRYQATLYGQPSHPEVVRAATFSETIGTVTNSLGVDLPTQNAWVELGVTSNPLWYWVPTFQPGSNTFDSGPSSVSYVDLAYGNETDKTIIINKILVAGVSSSEEWSTPQIPHDLRFCYVPAGSTIYARRVTSNTTPTPKILVTGLGG